MNLVSCRKPFFNYPKKSFFTPSEHKQNWQANHSQAVPAKIFSDLLIIKRSWGRHRELFVWIKNHGWMGEVSMLECQFMLKFGREKIVYVKCGRSEEEMKKNPSYVARCSCWWFHVSSINSCRFHVCSTNTSAKARVLKGWKSSRVAHWCDEHWWGIQGASVHVSIHVGRRANSFSYATAC